MGEADGLTKGQSLEVYKEINIAGANSNKLIGEVKILEVMGASRCLAKVSKGGEDILQVMSAGGNLPVKTKEVKQGIFSKTLGGLIGN